MDISTALAISSRFMDMQAPQLRAVAETLADQEGAGRSHAVPPGSPGAGALHPSLISGSATADDVRRCLAANLEVLRLMRTMLSRTVEALR